MVQERLPHVWGYLYEVPLSSLLIAMFDSMTMPPPEPLREFRAVWVASVDYIDFPTDPGLSVQVQKQQLAQIVESCVKAKLNAILFQVRPSADALYLSNFEPWSEYLTGKQGVPHPDNWDPLADLIRMCKPRGIEVHAWINPFRAKHPSAKGPLHDSHVKSRFPEGVLVHGRSLWMDPSSAELRRHTLNVIRDLIRRYSLDGIHMDDYFYPYPVKGVKFPDDASFSRYKDGGGKLELSEWRRENVNGFVRDLYQLAKTERPELTVGISPFGIYRPGIPKGIEAGLDQFADLYADPVKWIKSGWCDYVAPQLYWKRDSKGQPYQKLLQWWLQTAGSRVDCWPGLYTSRLGKEFGDWPADEIEEQVVLTRESQSRLGHIHFSQRAFRHDFKGIASKSSKVLYPSMALTPLRRGGGNTKVAAPKLVVRGNHVFAESMGAIAYVMQTLESGKWKLVETSLTGAMQFPKADRIAVAAMDQWRRLSAWTVLKASGENLDEKE